jgi:hypothetical protein
MQKQRPSHLIIQSTQFAMNYFIVAALIAVSLLCYSCGQDKQGLKDTASVQELEKTTADQKIADNNHQYFNTDSAGTQTGSGEQKKQPVPPVANPDWDKKIIKTASLNLEIKDYNAYYTSLREKIRNLGGYVAQEEQTLTDYKSENTVVIKVPVDQFDNALVQLITGVEKINEKKVNSQDVTAEYVDTRSRMEARKRVRDRYLDLLKQAKNMEEILNVQSEINRIQEEVESAAGRIEYLGHSASLSTINLTYYQVLNVSAKSDDKPGFGSKIASAFRVGGGWIVDLFIGMVTIWPLLLLGFLGFIYFRKNRTQKAKA